MNKITQKTFYWTALVLFAYMPFHIFLSQWLSTFTGGLDAWKVAKDVITAVLVSGLVVTVFLTKKYTKTYLGILALSIGYLLLHLLLFVTTNQPADSGFLGTTYNNRLIWYVLIGYSLALLLPKRPALDRVFAKYLIGFASIVAVLAFLQWLLPKDILTHFGYSIDRGVKPNFFIDDKPDLPRLFSTLRDPNSLGAFLILPSTLVLLALRDRWGTSQRTLLGGLYILLGLIIVLTFSRSAWIGVFIAHSLALGFVMRTHLKVFLKRFALPVVILMLLIGLGAYTQRDQYFVQNVILHSDESTQEASSNDLHMILIQKGLEGVEEHPLGQGPGTAGIVSIKHPNGLITENYFIQIAYEVGIFGLLLFLIFLGILVRSLWIRRQNFIALALLTSFFGLVFMNMLLHTWSNEAVAISWFMLAGIVIALAPKRQT